MSILVAYIPVLNKRHLDWFDQHPGSSLYLISQERAERLIPRLGRNMGAIPTEVMRQILTGLDPRWFRHVNLFDPEGFSPCLTLPVVWSDFFLPDEDVSHAVVEESFGGVRANIRFEKIWARFDMRSITQAHQVVPGVRISSEQFDQEYMQYAVNISGKSPDWWRQVGATLVCQCGTVVSACNVHMPTEYEVYVFGDPRTNYDAGQPGKYAALHAERGVIAACAGSPWSTRGSSLYVTTFPCEDCAREIVACGVARVFFKEGYSTLNAQEVLRSGGIEIIQVVNNPGSA